MGNINQGSSTTELRYPAVESKHPHLLVTGLHSLKSDKEFNWAENISEGTHIQIRFCEYGRTEEGPGHPIKTWKCIISDDDLFKLLSENNFLSVEER